MAEPEIRYTTTADGVSIAYYTMGEGLPLVVTSPVLWSHLRGQLFREYQRSRSGQGLGRGLQVVRYDARGTGLSDRHTLDFSMAARLLDLEAVVERLQLTRFAIFGLANGVPAAIAYAAGHPERVSHLILIRGYARGRDWREASRDLDSMRERADERWERYTLTLANSNLGFSDSESARKLASVYRESMTLESMRAFVEAQDAIDVTPHLPRVAVPALVMSRAGSGDPIRLEWSRELASKIPDARFVTVAVPDGTGWTDEETRIVEDFLGVNQDAPAVPIPDAPPLRGRTPSAFRVILFTDIVGQPEMMQRLGDAKGRDVLRDHERITREALQQHGGDEVKTDGDSFMATFTSPSAAVECAIALQRAFAQHAESGGEPIVVRMGLNVGEPIEEEGDFFGSAVILASRIRDLAGGGEILVPEAVRHMLSGKSFVFADRGEFAMKGFADVVRVYEVRWRE
jgi:class 3 adenylate cyclase